MSYLYDGKTYDNYGPAFMAELGMSEEAIASVTAQRDWDATEGQLARRKRRYETESDPLYLEWQYDKTPESEQAWRDKVSEIKAQLPIGVNPPITESSVAYNVNFCTLNNYDNSFVGASGYTLVGSVSYGVSKY